jgi:hypothetical protein
MNREEYENFLDRTVFVNQLIYKENTFEAFMYVGMLLHLSRNPKVSLEELCAKFGNNADTLIASVMNQIKKTHPKKTQYCKKKIDIEKVIEAREINI